MRSEATNEIDENLYYIKNIISPDLDGQGRVAAGVKYAKSHYFRKIFFITFFLKKPQVLHFSIHQRCCMIAPTR